MAASGGFWIKGSGGASAGKLFVPAMKQGAGASIKVGPVAGEYVNGISQGHMILHKAPNKTGQYWISNMTTGETVVKGLKTEAVGKAALETMHMVGGIKNPDPKVGATYTGKTNADIPPLQSKLLNAEGKAVEHGAVKAVDKAALAAKKAAAQQLKEAQEAEKFAKKQQQEMDAQAAKEYAAQQAEMAADKAAAATKQAAKAANAKIEKAIKLDPDQQYLASKYAKMSEQAVNAGLSVEPEHLHSVSNGIPLHGNSMTGYKVYNKDGNKIVHEWTKSVAIAKTQKYLDQQGIPGDKTPGSGKAIAKQAAKGMLPETAQAAAPAKAAPTWKEGNVQITTLMGKKETVTGMLTEKGDYAVTKNPKTGQYHVTELASGKTIAKHGDMDAAKQDALAYSTGAKTTTTAPAAKPVSSYGLPKDVPANYKVYKSLSEANSDLKQAYAPQAQNWSGQQVDALKHWSSTSGCIDINTAAWSGNVGKASAKGQTSIKHLDSLFEQSKTPHDMVVVRTDYIGNWVHKIANNLKVGDNYIAKGYDAASANASWGAGSSARFVYHVPAGTKAVYLNAKSASHYGSEGELLFKRGLVWKVAKIDGGDYHLEYAGEL